jgi:hypothetical protein
MRKTFSLLVVLGVMLVIAAPASAIQFGAPDGNDHPQVGLMVAKAGDVPLRRCTGTLIAPTVFLTAGHCTVGANSVSIWFSAGPITSGTYGNSPAGTPCGGHVGYPCTGSDVSGTPHTHSLFDGFVSVPNTHDLGLVVLDTPRLGPYASLAAEGYLDGVKNGARTTFDLVGYGIQDALPPVLSGQRTRYAGQAQLVNTMSSWNAGYNIQLSAAPGTGGAICHGDSGGPVFLPGTTTIVAVNSLARTHCTGNALSYRTDTADSLAFINGLPPYER